MTSFNAIRKAISDEADRLKRGTDADRRAWALGSGVIGKNGEITREYGGNDEADAEAVAAWRADIDKRVQEKP